MPNLLKALPNALAAVNKAARRTTFPPSVRNIMLKYGNQTIRALDVGRTVLNSAIQKVVKAVGSSEVFQKVKDNENGVDDKLRHLFVIATLDNGTKLRMERNQVINFTTNVGKVDEKMSVPLKKSISLDSFVSNAYKSQGQAFFHYSATQNNCQDFVVVLLRANGLLTDSLKSFIKQPTTNLVKPFIAKVADHITDTAATVDRIMEGEGHLKGRGHPYHVSFSNKPMNLSF